MTQVPAGWYPDGSGNERWWDGERWTAHTVAPPTNDPAATASTNLGPGQPFMDEVEPQELTTATTPTVGQEAETKTRQVAQAKRNALITGLSLLLCCGLPILPIYLWRRGKVSQRWGIGLAIAWIVLYFVGFAYIGETADTTNTNGEISKTHEAASPKPTRTPKVVVLLFITEQKDGDSFVASDGNEYRLGLVNTPEVGEPCADEAAAFTRTFVAAGFTANAYTVDVHGRKVAEVFNKNKKSLNVALAKSGFGNDKYLARFRRENEDLARRLDAAFASAPTPPCLTPAAPVPAPAQAPQPTQQSTCMAGYSPCLPIVADLDCPDIGHPVTVTGSDPYRLDRDHDGIGCD